MKKEIIIILFMFAFVLAIFFTNKMTEESKLCRFGKCEKVRRYGLLNKESKREDVVYKLTERELIVSAILFETIFFPFLHVGFYLYKPVKFKEIKKSKKPNQAKKSKKTKKKIIIFKARNLQNKGKREKKDL